MSGPTEGNLNASTPAAPSGKQNCVFQADSPYLDPITGLYERDISAYPPSAGSSLEGAIAIAGDIGGTSGTPKIVGIQGKGVSATSPTNGQVLQYNSGSGLYLPVTLSGSSGGPSPTPRRWAYGTTTTNGLSTSAGNWVGDGDSAANANGTAAANSGVGFNTPVSLFTSASNAATMGVQSNLCNTATGWTVTGQNILFQSKVGMSVITGVRVRVGMNNATGTATWLASDSLTTLNYAAFRFSTSASDVNWQCETGDGSAVTTQDSGIAVAANTLYLLQIRYNDATPNIVFSINGTVVATSTTHLPAASKAQSHIVAQENLTALSRTIYIAWIYEEADN